MAVMFGRDRGGGITVLGNKAQDDIRPYFRFGAGFTVVRRTPRTLPGGSTMTLDPESTKRASKSQVVDLRTSGQSLEILAHATMHLDTLLTMLDAQHLRPLSLLDRHPRSWTVRPGFGAIGDAAAIVAGTAGTIVSRSDR